MKIRNWKLVIFPVASSSRQNIYWIILTVVGVAVVGAAFYIVFLQPVRVPSSDNQKKGFEPASSQLEDSSKNQEIIQAEDGWQVYRNYDLGFEIKYPEGWETELLYDFNLSFKKKGDKKFYELKSGDYLTFYYPDLRVSVAPTSQTDIKKYQDDLCDQLMKSIGACSIVVQETALAGVKALKLIHCVESANREGFNFIKNGRLFSVTTPYLCLASPNRQEYSKDEQDIINQYKALQARYAPIHKEILESFKFIK